MDFNGLNRLPFPSKVAILMANSVGFFIHNVPP